MNPYVMRGNNDCGPSAVAAVTELDNALVDRAFGVTRIDRFRDLLDSPYHHFVALDNLGIPWRRRTLEQILTGQFARGKVIMLSHAPDDPDTWIPEALTGQHWVVIEGIDAEFGYVIVHDADPSYPNGKCITNEGITRRYSASLPACAYEVGTGDEHAKWWERAWVILTKIFFGG